MEVSDRLLKMAERSEAKIQISRFEIFLMRSLAPLSHAISLD